ncbi:MAG TPA: hypothetical protein VL943_15965, partial [Niabella sp.]|nr:hypothetical protein [Niabella sp.]
MSVLYKHWLFILIALSANQYLQAQTDTTYKSLDSIRVVTGQYTPKSLVNSLYKVRLINNEQIRMRGATDLL